MTTNTEKKMTKRDFLNAVSATTNDPAIKEFALEELERLNRRNENRSSKQASKTAEQNAPYIAAIMEYMDNHSNVTAAEISEKVEISVQKASALLRGLVASEKLTATEVKIPKKGKCKAYNLATAE